MLVTMNDSDINRFKVIQDVCDRRIRRVDAADILDLSVRQVQRLMNRLREFGLARLTHQVEVSQVTTVIPATTEIQF